MGSDALVMGSDALVMGSDALVMDSDALVWNSASSILMSDPLRRAKIALLVSKRVLGQKKPLVLRRSRGLVLSSDRLP